MLDGVEIASATADSTGDFAALFDLPPAGAGRLMTMIATASDGTMLEAPTKIAVAQTTAPVAVAQAIADQTSTAATTTADAGTDAGTDATANSAAATTAATTNTVASTTTAPAATSTADAATATATGTTAAVAATGTTALAITDRGAKVLQTGTAVPAEIAANVTLDVISYPTPDQVQFGGKGKPGAFVRLYIDNAPLGTAATIAADGNWTMTQTGVAPKIYTLRVDELDSAGKVISRYETPFKRETPETLAAATTTTPVVTADATATALVTGTDPSSAATADAKTADPGTTAKTAATAPPAPVTVTVQPGFTLWGIAKSHLGEGIFYVQVYNANKDKIKNPDLIYPGQIFTVPQN